MEKKDNKPNLPRLRIKQPNEITMARYDLTRTEKNIMYYAVKYLQEKIGTRPDVIEEINKRDADGLLELNRTLFGDFLFSIPMSYIRDVNDITGNETNTTKIWQAAKSLREKSFEIKTGRCWFSVGFFNWVKFDTKTGLLHLEMSHKLIPFILKAVNNYTLYSFITALSFKKVYSQRFYEFCHRFRETGYWRVTPEELKDMLKIENKYKNWNDIKRKVIEPAQQELREKGDIFFTYREMKHGRRVVVLEFYVHTKKPANPAERDRIMKTADYKYISMLLDKFITDKKFVNRALEEFACNETKLVQFAERLKRLDDDIASGKRLAKVGGLLRTILNEDYGIY
jgi:plasmid replication initiation protein